MGNTDKNADEIIEETMKEIYDDLDRDKVFEEVIEEVHFLKDIYTEEEIHSKLIEEIDKNANIKM